MRIVFVGFQERDMKHGVDFPRRGQTQFASVPSHLTIDGEGHQLAGLRLSTIVDHLEFFRAEHNLITRPAGQLSRRCSCSRTQPPPDPVKVDGDIEFFIDHIVNHSEKKRTGKRMLATLVNECSRSAGAATLLSGMICSMRRTLRTRRPSQTMCGGLASHTVCMTPMTMSEQVPHSSATHKLLMGGTASRVFTRLCLVANTVSSNVMCDQTCVS